MPPSLVSAATVAPTSSSRAQWCTGPAGTVVVAVGNALGDPDGDSDGVPVSSTAGDAVGLALGTRVLSQHVKYTPLLPGQH